MTDRLAVAISELVEALREELRTEADASPRAPDQLLDVLGAARQLGLGRTVCYRLIDSGQLRSMKVGRRRLVPQSAVDAFIARAAA